MSLRLHRYKYLVLVLIARVKEKREFFPHYDGPRRRYLRAHNYSNQGTQPLQEVSFRCFVCLSCKRKSTIFFDGDGIFGHPPSPSSDVIEPESTTRPAMQRIMPLPKGTYSKSPRADSKQNPRFGSLPKKGISIGKSSR